MSGGNEVELFPGDELQIDGGDTEDDALAEWARNRGVRLWNEEGL